MVPRDQPPQVIQLGERMTDHPLLANGFGARLELDGLLGITARRRR